MDPGDLHLCLDRLFTRRERTDDDRVRAFDRTDEHGKVEKA